VKLIRESKPMHGCYYRREPDLSWWQYWRGIRHTWYWHGIPVWSVCRKRDRPMYEMIKMAIGN